MSQAIIKDMNLPNKTSQQLWLLVILLSVLLHLVLIAWFSSKTPNFPDVNPNEFKVGLMTSEGMGDTLKASLPDVESALDVELEDSIVVSQQDLATEIPQEQILEVSEQMPIEQAQVDNIELATVITPETSFLPDVSPPALETVNEAVDQKPIESQPVEMVTAIVPVTASIEADSIETIGMSVEVEDVAPSDDFFKPAEVISADDPVITLPIEHLSAVPAPEAIEANITPELAKYDVEILEIKAHDLIVRPKPTPVKPKPILTQNTTGDNSLHAAQSLLARSGDKAVESANQPVAKATKPKPLVIPQEYMLELKSWLNQYKKYPQQAHRLNQQGVVIVSLKIEKSGKIISSEIKRSSGHKLLDKEVDNMIKRATKLPALPANFPRDELELLIPIRFKVR